MSRVASRGESSWEQGGVEGAMRTIKGPAIFLAQFAGDAAPFNSLKSIAAWAAKLGYKGVQIPSWDARLFDLKRAAESKSYCDEISRTRSEERRVGKECRYRWWREQ